MSLILPSAPANFYEPSLAELKAVLEITNGSTKGQLCLITAVPADIENAWAEVGAAGDTAAGANRGTLVVGNADIGIITGPVKGAMEAEGEYGYKLQFSEVPNIPVYIDGTGTSITTVIGIALVEGINNFISGSDSMLRYIFKVNSLVVTDNALLKLPETEIAINFSEEDGVVETAGANLNLVVN